MNHRLHELSVACRPFVTRALRGPRRRRISIASGLLALVVVLMSTWVGLSSGRSAHDLRVELGMEEYRWDREETEFTIFADSQFELEILQQRGPEPTGPYRHRAQDAWTLLDMIASPHVVPPDRFRSLQAQARELRDARIDLAPPDLEDRRRYANFNWNSTRDLKRLRAIIDARLEPQIVLYRSPLDMAATVRLMGIFASGLLLLLLTVCAPLWVGVRLAQELHENTLQPLTGTALTARQLVTGLVAGPLAPIAIVAAPLVVLVLATAIGAGRLLPTAGFLLSSIAMAAMLTGLAMLGALAVGRRRAPGLVGIGLLALLGIAAITGIAVGVELDRKIFGLVTIVPGAGPVHLLTEAFNPVAHLRAEHAHALDLRLVLATVGGGVLAAIAWRAIERWIGGTHQEGALRPLEAFVAALTLTVLAMAAMPPGADFGETLFVGTAVVLVPLQLVLMGRVPGVDVPPSLRQIPTVRLLREHSCWLALGLGVAFVIGGAPETIRAGLPLGIIHLAWALVVVALVTIRTAALPSSIPTKIWLVVCLGFAMLEYGTGAIWCMERVKGEMLFPLAAISPVLGLVHVGMFLWIPVSLLRGLTPADRGPLDLRDEPAPDPTRSTDDDA